MRHEGFYEIIKLLKPGEKRLLALPPRSQAMLFFLYGICETTGEPEAGGPRTLQETGEAFGLSRERVRQIADKALRQLKIGT